MSASDFNVTAEIKSRLSLADIVGRYVELRQVGENWSAPCPFHEETKPSFTVNPQKGFYYCFGCQASGDIFDFYANINGLDFPEALRQLAAEAGVELAAGKHTDSTAEKSRVSVAQEVNSFSASYFREMLSSGSGDQARQYLKSRSISAEISSEFRMGWSPDGWQNLMNRLKAKGFTPEDGILAGVLSQNQKGKIYDRFRARLIFPIISLSGMVVAFGGRVLGDEEPKYLNSSESPVYKKGEHLYGLYQARKHVTQTRKIYLTEGYLDVMALHQYGLANSCGVLGTSLTSAQVKRLSGLCREVILLFDGDRAGRMAALRSAEMILKAGLKCRVLTFPEGEDAHSLLTSRGRETFDSLVEGCIPGLDYCLETIKTDKSPREVMAWVNNFFKDLEDISLKTFYIPKVAGVLGLTESELRKSFENPSSGLSGQNSGSSQSSRGAGPAQRDRELLTFATCFPEFRKDLEQCNVALVLNTEWAKKYWGKIKDMEGEDHLSGFEPDEREFYFHSRLQESELRANRQDIFKEIELFVNQCLMTMTRQNLKQALVRAQKSGDLHEVKRILGLMQGFF